ncbi:hypothetical protein ACVWXM_002508 [Bradyrhizobium sp. GM7.3]
MRFSGSDLERYNIFLQLATLFDVFGTLFGLLFGWVGWPDRWGLCFSAARRRTGTPAHLSVHERYMTCVALQAKSFQVKDTSPCSNRASLPKAP